MCAPAGHCAGRTRDRKGTIKVRSARPVSSGRWPNTASVWLTSVSTGPTNAATSAERRRIAGSMVDVTNGLVSSSRTMVLGSRFPLVRIRTLDAAMFGGRA